MKAPRRRFYNLDIAAIGYIIGILVIVGLLGLTLYRSIECNHRGGAFVPALNGMAACVQRLQ
jgi:hypothetical protein